MLSGGVVVALAAGLWLIYLVPSWLRRREYMSSERNAVRLQQTLRVLAETAEVPEAVRLEATAREAAVQERILKRVQEKAAHEARLRAEAEARAWAEADAKARAEASARARQAEQARRAELARQASRVARTSGADAVTAASKTRSRRATRAFCSAIVVLSLGAVIAGVLIASSGGSWLVLGMGAVPGVLAVSALVRLARPQRAAPVQVVTASRPTADELYDHAVHDEPAPVEQPVQAWTPRPLPKPLYQSTGSIAASAMASADAAAELHRAAARAMLEQRAAAMRAPVTPIAAGLEKPDRGRVVGAASASARPSERRPMVRTVRENHEATAPSRFARMGMVDEIDGSELDLDAVLRRRRVG
jgi:hypothetical protein